MCAALFPRVRASYQRLGRVVQLERSTHFHFEADSIRQGSLCQLGFEQTDSSASNVSERKTRALDPGQTGSAKVKGTQKKTGFSMVLSESTYRVSRGRGEKINCIDQNRRQLCNFRFDLFPHLTRAWGALFWNRCRDLRSVFTSGK